MPNDPFKENIEKSKKVLKDYFKQRSLERNKNLFTPKDTGIEFHNYSTFKIDKEEFDEVIGTDIDFIDTLIWNDNTKEKRKIK